MEIDQLDFSSFLIRTAHLNDAHNLVELRLQVDGETENLDREKGEAYIDEEGFRSLIEKDGASGNSLFLVAEENGQLVAFSRCAGSDLKRTLHQTEFGIAVVKAFWDHGIGQNLLTESIRWADEVGISKISLKVLETNIKAINLYKKYGFEVEGILKKDKLLSDGNYYNTVLMGRINENT
ncbi:GNAT family N-acetyltransferase [Planococcus soli]|uniref:GNAT family N-acetyltransferase n=1 Tax=Planococcus soli TaxID=2666072 RepID=UPI00115E3F8D|nr:GNAT family N-acetyltransferase [Planococcus soli]